MGDVLKSPYGLGIDAGWARVRGEGVPVNPYPPGTVEWQDFDNGCEDGWSDAHEYWKSGD